MNTRQKNKLRKRYGFKKYSSYKAYMEWSHYLYSLGLSMKIPNYSNFSSGKSMYFYNLIDWSKRQEFKRDLKFIENYSRDINERYSFNKPNMFIFSNLWRYYE